MHHQMRITRHQHTCLHSIQLFSQIIASVTCLCQCRVRCPYFFGIKLLAMNYDVADQQIPNEDLAPNAKRKMLIII